MNASPPAFGLVPEQDWENPALPPSPFGTPPEHASIGFDAREGGRLGLAVDVGAGAEACGSRCPSGAGRPLEQPDIVRARYVTQAPPGALPLTRHLARPTARPCPTRART